jgi:hypothetical protein
MHLSSESTMASALVAPAVPVLVPSFADEDDLDDIEPRLFFDTDRMRRILAQRKRTPSGIADSLGIPPVQHNDYGSPHQLERALLAANLERLVGCGLVSIRRPRGGEGGRMYRLTAAGRKSLEWAGPPKPPGANERAWAADLVRAIADFYGVGVADVLRGRGPGEPTIARARFAYALWARGWSTDRIEGSFGMPPSWAERGVARWQRIRFHEAPPAPHTKRARKGEG